MRNSKGWCYTCGSWYCREDPADVHAYPAPPWYANVWVVRLAIVGGLVCLLAALWG